MLDALDRRRVTALGIVVASLAMGCATPDRAQVTIANRSDAILTVGPGLDIPACASTTVTLADYEKVRDEGVRMAMSGQQWDAPAGALVWDLAIVSARGSDPTGTITVVVSSSADPDVRSGTIADDALPACGGQPQGIEPGTPQGEGPVFTMEPASS